MTSRVGIAVEESDRCTEPGHWGDRCYRGAGHDIPHISVIDSLRVGALHRSLEERLPELFAKVDSFESQFWARAHIGYVEAEARYFRITGNVPLWKNDEGLSPLE